MPVSCLLIAWVYRRQYAAGSAARQAMVAVHTLSVAAIVLTYFWLCWDHFRPTPWMYPGWAVFAAGSILFWYAAFRHKASLVPREGYTLFNEGPYRYMRHPIYTGGIFGAAGLALVAPAWEVWMVWGVLVASLCVLIALEEAELRKRYNGAYTAYCKHTARLIPFVL